MWFSWRYWLTKPMGWDEYVWVEVELIRETKKAILVMFESRKAWFPKAWILCLKRDEATKTAKIKISYTLWVKKF